MICYFIVSVLIIIAISSFVSWFGLHRGHSLSQIVLKSLVPEPTETLPRKFKISDSYIIPIWNQFDRGTCWAFAATYLLESQYKNQGIHHRFLKPNEYVSFSQESLAKTMVDHCNENPTHKLCIRSGRGKNRTAGGRVEDLVLWAKAFPSIARSVLPASACPYQFDPEKQMICPDDVSESLRTNPLEFSILNSEITTGIESVKKLLFKVQRPLSFSLAMPMQRYWFECSNQLVSETETCTYSLYPCSFNSSEFCAPKDYPLFKGSDSELIFHPTTEIMPGTGHAMVLVAYNDDFIPKNNGNIDGKSMPKGGFIVRNSWGAKGHSLEYLINEISDVQENSICSNSGNIMTWTPATLECIKHNIHNVSNCSTDITQIYGSKIVKGAFKLKCINKTHCDVDKTYVILRKDNETREISMEFSNTGVPIAKVIEIDENANTFMVKTIHTVPIQHLYYAFQTEESLLKEYGERCGHIFFSYEAMKRIMSIQTVSSPSWRVLDLNIMWHKKSFPNSGRNYNYSHIVQSTKMYSPLNVSHPYDILDL
ncbi:hypothetical protein TRFO_22967 [Tritrichomonas foetus]|uniref:Uncharacterized protein n=1 Tax=Tritrichomonas foetus TaxID=1144522 RepID=A0A1J4KB71_9EUKA|nr:hypothetical protein TRFO_22967 [Tritrichomonas foetus]|eukprot:OHT08467.1 hypothetical protein TRFO_22967 [Tritrichomonas foetus]